MADRHQREDFSLWPPVQVSSVYVSWNFILFFLGILLLETCHWNNIGRKWWCCVIENNKGRKWWHCVTENNKGTKWWHCHWKNGDAVSLKIRKGESGDAVSLKITKGENCDNVSLKMMKGENGDAGTDHKAVLQILTSFIVIILYVKQTRL